MLRRLAPLPAETSQPPGRCPGARSTWGGRGGGEGGLGGGGMQRLQLAAESSGQKQASAGRNGPPGSWLPQRRVRAGEVRGPSQQPAASSPALTSQTRAPAWWRRSCRTSAAAGRSAGAAGRLRRGLVAACGQRQAAEQEASTGCTWRRQAGHQAQANRPAHLQAREGAHAQRDAARRVVLQAVVHHGAGAAAHDVQRGGRRLRAGPRLPACAAQAEHTRGAAVSGCALRRLRLLHLHVSGAVARRRLAQPPAGAAVDQPLGAAPHVAGAGHRQVAGGQLGLDAAAPLAPAGAQRGGRSGSQSALSLCCGRKQQHRERREHSRRGAAAAAQAVPQPARALTLWRPGEAAVLTRRRAPPRPAAGRAWPAWRRGTSDCRIAPRAI